MEEARKLFDLTILALDGREVCLSQYGGHITLIIRITAKNIRDVPIEELNRFASKYRNRPFLTIVLPETREIAESYARKVMEQNLIVTKELDSEEGTLSLWMKESYDVRKYYQKHYYVVDTNGLIIKAMSSKNTFRRVRTYVKLRIPSYFPQHLIFNTAGDIELSQDEISEIEMENESYSTVIKFNQVFTPPSKEKEIVM